MPERRSLVPWLLKGGVCLGEGHFFSKGVTPPGLSAVFRVNGESAGYLR